MARITGQFGILFESQPVDGTLAPGLLAIVGAPGGPYGESNGLVLGDSDSGVGGSGITFTAGRNIRDAGSVAGSFTRLFDDFLNETVESFSFAFPLSGNRTTPGPAGVDADFKLAAGLEAILAACGLAGAAWAGGLGYEYKPANTAACSALIFDSGRVYALIDLQGSLAIDFTAGAIPIATATFTGKVDHANSGGAFTFPTLNYGTQESVSPVSVKEVSNAFGQTRGFASLSLSVDNSIEQVPDSNAVDGARIEQSDRAVSVQVTIDVDSANSAFDWDNLTADVAQTDDLTFQIGAVNADDGTDPADAVRVECNNLNIQTLGLDRPARAKANVLEALCTSTVDGGEFSLIFN